MGPGSKHPLSCNSLVALPSASCQTVVGRDAGVEWVTLHPCSHLSPTNNHFTLGIKWLKACSERGLALPRRRLGHNGGPHIPGHTRFAKYLVALQAPLSLTTRKFPHFPYRSLGALDSLSIRPGAVLTVPAPFPDWWVWRRILVIVHHLQDEMMGQEGAETFTPPFTMSHPGIPHSMTSNPS